MRISELRSALADCSAYVVKGPGKNGDFRPLEVVVVAQATFAACGLATLFGVATVLEMASALLVLADVSIVANFCGMGRFGPQRVVQDQLTDYEKIFGRILPVPTVRSDAHCFLVLGLSESASDNDIRQRRKALLRVWHPDRNPGDKAAEDRFKEIQSAYEMLMR